jgi:hypothetical protein
MWIFTPTFMVSVVSHRDDPATVLVRARCITHLERLKAQHQELASIPIVGTKDADYAVRMYVGKETWAKIMAAIACDVTYPNFKGEAARLAGETNEDRRYVNSLHRIWSTMYAFQHAAD